VINATFDASAFLELAGKKKIAFIEGLIAGVDFGMTELPKAFTKNLMGVRHQPGTRSPYPGQLPVTRISTELSKSTKIRRVDPVSGLVFIDERNADYAIHVHDGTRRMKARPFAREAVNERRPAILQRTNREVKKRMDKLG
jgi:HK97 gp10 family phage protein